MDKDIEYVLYTEEQIKERVNTVASQIMARYKDKNPVFVGILKGSFVFMADLMRAMDIYCEMDFMAVSSYGSGSESSGDVKISKDLNIDIAGRHVVIIEDILDSGLTLERLKNHLKSRKAASLAVAVLLDKEGRRRVSMDADFVGFTIPDAYVVGYGLDFNQKYRNLPYIGVLKPEIYS